MLGDHCFFLIGVLGIIQPTIYCFHKIRGWKPLLPPPHPSHPQSIKGVTTEGPRWHRQPWAARATGMCALLPEGSFAHAASRACLGPCLRWEPSCSCAVGKKRMTLCSCNQRLLCPSSGTYKSAPPAPPRLTVRTLPPGTLQPAHCSSSCCSWWRAGLSRKPHGYVPASLFVKVPEARTLKPVPRLDYLTAWLGLALNVPSLCGGHLAAWRLLHEREEKPC